MPSNELRNFRYIEMLIAEVIFYFNKKLVGKLKIKMLPKIQLKHKGNT